MRKKLTARKAALINLLAEPGSAGDIAAGLICGIALGLAVVHAFARWAAA